MTRVTAATTTTTARTRTAPLDREASLKAIAVAFEKAKKPAKAELVHEGHDVHAVKGSDARALEVYVDTNERSLLASKGKAIHHLYVDDKNGQFYASSYAETVGPLPLPKGVSWASLLDTTAHKPKNAEEKATAAIAAHVKGDLFAAHVAGRTHIDASKRGHRHVYIKDPSGVIPGQGLIVAKDKMWIEMIPGYSGDCIGPFTLPKGYTRESLVEALTSTKEAPKPKPSTDATETGGRRRTVLIGGDSSRWPTGGGGRGSGLTPLSVRFRGGGGGGGSP